MFNSNLFTTYKKNIDPMSYVVFTWLIPQTHICTDTTPILRISKVVIKHIVGRVLTLRTPHLRTPHLRFRPSFRCLRYRSVSAGVGCTACAPWCCCCCCGGCGCCWGLFEPPAEEPACWPACVRSALPGALAALKRNKNSYKQGENAQAVKK